MFQFFGYGNEFISNDQYLSLPERRLKELARDSRPLRRTSRFSATSTDVAEGVAPLAEPKPIGIGNPLSIELLYVYTGGLSRYKYDMLLSSAVKQVPVYNAAPRAVQAVVPKVPENFGFASLPATLAGTPLLYYTPALTNRGLTLTVEMVFDKFPEDAVNQVGTMLATAAGIPAFAPASAYLLAGSMIVKLFAKIAEALVDGRASFAQTLDINLERPLHPDTSPGSALLTPSSALADKLEKKLLRIDPLNGLVDATSGKPLVSPDPYVIIGLDGTTRPDYANFTPTLATASVLSRFLHVGDGQPTATGLIVDALKAYNDVYYRSLADRTSEELKGIADQSSPDALRLKKLLEAYIKNIGNPDLRPKS